MNITRRSLLQSLFVALAARHAHAAAVVSTLVGTGAGGFSDEQVNNPYGVIFGPDGAMYFCDLDNQRIRRLDMTHAPHDDDRRQRSAGLRGRRRTGDRGVAEHAARDPVRRARQSLHRRARQPRDAQSRRPGRA